MYPLLFSLYQLCGLLIHGLTWSLQLSPFGKKHLLKERLTPAFPALKSTIWIVAASLGEAKGAINLAEELRLLTDATLLITTTSHHALLYLRQAPLPSQTFCAIAPLDSPRALATFKKKCTPILILLYEAEYWPHILHTFQHSPIHLISAAMRQKVHTKLQRLHRVLHSIATRHFKSINSIIAQDALHATRYSLIHSNVKTGTNLKVLSFTPPKNSAQSEKTKNGIALCSFHIKEWPLFIKSVTLSSDPLYIVPRTLSELSDWKKELQKEFGNFSLFPYTTTPVILVETFGVMDQVLDRCDRAVIGGSFSPIGIHNIWEPLAKGCTLFCGPYYELQEALITELTHLDLITILTPNKPTNLHFQSSVDAINELSNVYFEKTQRTRTLLTQVVTPLISPMD
ncbi:MAG: hypothetical protein OCD01_18240 [Fibrobacterales bacterium]